MTAAGFYPSENLAHAASGQPSAWVTRFAPLIPAGEVLDLACGGGRHSRLLAGLGFPVLAVDRNAEALSSLAAEGIPTLQLDLETGKPDAWPFAAGRFAGIIVTNYLYRPLFHSILQGLQDGGILIYETFASGNERFGKPSNPDFLLKPGELLDLARNDQPQALRVIAFEDGYVAQPKAAMVQRICAKKTGIQADFSSFDPNLFRISPLLTG